MVTFSAVKWLRNGVALLLLALWLPVTLHCRLETVPLFKFLVCCCHDEANPHQDNDCDQDSCGTVEFGFYKIDDHPPLKVTPTALLSVVASLGLAKIPQVPLPPLCLATLSPPDLPVSWQFSFRAALPPRAPSFVS